MAYQIGPTGGGYKEPKWEHNYKGPAPRNSPKFLGPKRKTQEERWSDQYETAKGGNMLMPAQGGSATKKIGEYASSLWNKAFGSSPQKSSGGGQRSTYNFHRSMDALSGGSPLTGVSGGDRVPYRRGMAPAASSTQVPYRRGMGPSKKVGASKSTAKSKKIGAKRSGTTKVTSKAAGKGKGKGKSWWGRQDSDTKNILRVGAGALGGLIAGAALAKGGSDTEYDIEYQGNVYNRTYNYGRY